MKALAVPLYAALLGASLVAAAQAAVPTVAALRWHRRIVLVASPRPDDPRAIAQRHILHDWRRGAADRDVALVEVSGGQVRGVADGAAALAARYRLAPGRFQVLLIGKDGQVALRAVRPLAAARLQGAIDAMPMRRAGGR